ncbi:hypothetical protein BPAE_0025g00240 [Botrytis paeoniae]|uniref:Uncharacterized protein n=1 Tax=Botrytis paeoniae TaxID=278948 RepID=A0A4Z1FVR4_9HELO|nr:hypothetical protein BPAE_0025g00240 [Botrytis paeoniae]
MRNRSPVGRAKELLMRKRWSEGFRGLGIKIDQVRREGVRGKEEDGQESDYDWQHSQTVSCGMFLFPDPIMSDLHGLFEIARRFNVM